AAADASVVVIRCSTNPPGVCATTGTTAAPSASASQRSPAASTSRVHSCPGAARLLKVSISPQYGRSARLGAPHPPVAHERDLAPVDSHLTDQVAPQGLYHCGLPGHPGVEGAGIRGDAAAAAGGRLPEPL